VTLVVRCIIVRWGSGRCQAADAGTAVVRLSAVVSMYGRGAELQ